MGFLNANRMPLRRHESILVFYPRLPVYHPQFTAGRPYRYRAGREKAAGVYKKTRVIGTENPGRRYPTSILEFPRETNGNGVKRLFHPTQKPVALFEWIVRSYTEPGAIVLDNCIGSGTTAVACIASSRHFIGIEKDPVFAARGRRANCQGAGGAPLSSITLPTFERASAPGPTMRAMKKLKRELAHVGMFGQDGSGVRVTKEDLAEVAGTFDGFSPVTLGHELADWMPKFGTVTKVELANEGASLVGEMEINDVLSDAVDEKFYEHLSVGIPRRASDRKRYLHHVGFLGAVPPKIRDLKVFADLGVLCYSDADRADIFADEPPAVPQPGNAPEDIAAALQRIADKGRAGWPLQDALKALGELATMASEMLLSGAAIPDSLRKEMQNFADQLTSAAGKAGKEENVGAQEENERLKKELADSRAVILTGAKEGIKTAMKGRIPAAKQGLVLELADRLVDAETIELADEADPTKKEQVSGLEVLRRVLESIPMPVTPGRESFADDGAGGKDKKPVAVSFNKA